MIFIERVDQGVGDAVIDGGQAGGAGVSEPGDLHGCGFDGEEGQAVMGHVHGEIDEDVDLIGADFVGKLRIGKRADIVPDVGGFAKAVGDRVRAGDAGVAVNLEAGVVVGFEKRDDEE